MTCLEKFKADHPDWSEEKIQATIKFHCPDTWGYLPNPSWCRGGNSMCEDCWNRELPEAYPDMVAAAKADMEKDVDEVVNGLFVGDERLEHPDTDLESGLREAMDRLKELRELIKNDTHTPKVICISGKAQNGKDTSAGILKDILVKCGYRVLITHYGDLVKYVCKTFFDWDGEKDEAGRSLLQFVGTDRVRAKRPDYWVDFVVSIVQMFPDQWDYVIIPDSRFPNEIDIFKEAGFDVTHARVIRAPFVSPLTLEQQMHISETALDGVRADVYIPNFGSLEDLAQEIDDKLVSRLVKKEED